MQYQAHVLQAERRGETRRLVLVAQNELAVILINRRGKKRAGEKFEIGCRVYFRLANQRHGLRERFDDAGEEEVSAQLHDVGERRNFANDPLFWPQSLEERLATLNDVTQAGNNNGQTPCFGGFGPAEDRRGDIFLLRCGVRGRELFGESHANRADGNVRHAARQ